MEREIAERIFAVQGMAKDDPFYKKLLAEHQILNDRFLEILPTLSDVQRDAVMDYLGLAFAMNLRLLELSCASWEKS